MNKKYTIPIIFGVAAIILLIASGTIKFGGQVVTGTNQKIAIPHMGAYSCQAVGTGSPVYNIGTNGFWIDKSTIGVYTDQINSLNVYVPQTFWDSFFTSYFGGGIRAIISVCDASHNGCVNYVQPLTFAGTTSLDLPFTSFNPNEKSVYVVIQARYTFVTSWTNNDYLNSNTQVGFSYTKYGLKYVSTTGNPAGSLFAGCESNCDLTCPIQKSRSDTGLLYTAKNSLLPTESVSVLEYWEDLNPDLNSQFGASIYNSANNLFCFGGVIYTAKTLTLDNGNSYIYPDTATRQNKDCCPGAVISTSTEDKICQSDYTWKTITKTTVISCVSDFNCPNQGQNTCQNRMLSGWHCTNDRVCVQGSSTQVSCCSQADCPADQTCQNNACVGGNYQKLTCPFGCCVGDAAYNDKLCSSGYNCINHSCVAITNNTLDCTAYTKFGGLIPSEPKIIGSQSCTLFVLFCKPVTTYTCESDYTFVYIIAAVILILLIVMLMRKKK